MFINTISSYLPSQVIKNDYFKDINGLSDEWILERTGIYERRKADSHENTHTMAIEATKAAVASLPYPVEEVDLIIGATYTPHDTIFTLGHALQHYLDISDIPVVTISTACSSFLNAAEIAQGYFAMGKASKALVVVSEHNSAYYNVSDLKSGHLWGDGAAAMFISKERASDTDYEVLDLTTGGAGNVGKAFESVTLKPIESGIIMPNGRDVFINACTYMANVTRSIVEKNGFELSDVDYLIPHQANLRITKNVGQSLGLPEQKAISNVQYLGNTGCAGCAIAMAQHKANFKKQELIVVTVFGGGYSFGAMLVRV